MYSGTQDARAMDRSVTLSAPFARQGGIDNANEHRVTTCAGIVPDMG
jgi:hypothetical protein